VTRAAARLGIQQPPLSQQIRALETELELQLFRRKPRGVELTPAGEAFLAEARIVLERAEHAVLAARRAARGEAGRLGLGFTSSASFHPLVPRVIRDFRETSPLVALSLEEAGTAELVEGLRAERIDAAFVRSPIGPAADLTVHSLLEEEMVAALPSGHRLAAGTKSRLPLSALEGETFILYRRPLGPGLYDAIIAACQRAGYSPRIGRTRRDTDSRLDAADRHRRGRLSCGGAQGRPGRALKPGLSPRRDRSRRMPLYRAGATHRTIAICRHAVSLRWRFDRRGAPSQIFPVRRSDGRSSPSSLGGGRKVRAPRRHGAG